VCACDFKTIKGGITVMSSKGESEEYSNIGIAIGFNVKNASGATYGVLDNLFGMRDIFCDSDIRFTLAQVA
jgi:hypothetical protein